MILRLPAIEGAAVRMFDAGTLCHGLRRKVGLAVMGVQGGRLRAKVLFRISTALLIGRGAVA